jgi:hypothetical protein
MAIAKTDWYPMTIGDPIWDGSLHYRLEVQKRGNAKRTVWVEVEDIRLKDGTKEGTIELPMKLRWAGDNSMAKGQYKFLVGRARVLFLRVDIAGISMPSGQPSMVTPCDAERLPFSIRLEKPEHSQIYFLVGVHDEHKRFLSKWIRFERDESVDIGHRAYTVKGLPTFKPVSVLEESKT